jgi:cellulose synthase/poly-beta-1,6-N-acetylglucosamine synthase-like glycosyltransferase
MYTELTFWVCFGLVAYIYAGYLAGVCVLAPILRRDVIKSDVTPSISVVISAFNEEREIERTVVNKLSQDYPSEQLEVIVVSDGSTDQTDEIVRGLVDRSEGRLKLFCQEPRQGKTQALNLALEHTSAEIVVFADANSMYSPKAIRSLVRSFADPSVGYVTGQIVYTNPTGSGVGAGTGSYMSYENLLRTCETRLGSIVGVDGGIDAIRRALYVPMQADQLPDFVLPLSVVEQGKRVVYEPDAVVYEPALSDAGNEFRMRVRVSLRAMWALYDKRMLLNPISGPLFAWQLMSHKVFRYGAFLPLFGLLASNMMVVGQHPFYAWFLGVQVVAYTFAIMGHFLRDASWVVAKLLMPYYFLIVNAACAFSFWKFLKGQKIVLWTPRVGA